MSAEKNYFRTLLSDHNISVPSGRAHLFEQFCEQEGNADIIEQILKKQRRLMRNWNIRNRVQDISEQAFVIANGTVGKAYQFTIDLSLLNWADVQLIDLEGLSDLGLAYDHHTRTVAGIPTNSGDHPLILNFRLLDDEQETVYKKNISLIINPDPKSLWKDLPSDLSDTYWKEDNSKSSSSFSDKHIVIGSKRGRSHANQGSFRDDDYQYAQLSAEWSIIAIADGAGSAQYSRRGSKEACCSVINYFQEGLSASVFEDFDLLVEEYHKGADAETLKNINLWLYQNLGGAAFHTHKELEKCALDMGVPISALHSTLAFSLLKKYAFGYAVLSFGVGDCPIVLISNDLAQVALLNTLDVGDYGGGTRFITMPEIFKNEAFKTRFNFKLVEDFKYLVMMTDGIYDPKFEVEANLSKPDQWEVFFKDLEGENPEGRQVILDPQNTDISDQLSSWMDFWSPGNHDDRTIAIIF